MGKNRNIIFIGVVLVIGALLLLLPSSPKGSGAKPNQQVTAAAAGVDKASLMALMSDQNKERFSFPEDWGPRNPFDNGSSSVARSGLVLTGIFLGGDKPSAIIDDVVVVVGRNIEGATVKEIKEGSVTVITSRGEEKVLKINLGSVTAGYKK